ncbi:MAG: amidohydrolase family protein [Chloroflexi bacterium]|nr:amidohydrolase family protein [Chloroflexota bacterium]
MFDLLITGGEVIDGTGRAAFRADVGVRAKRIAAVGDLSAAVARRVIDASGHIVSPGFIDTHVHTDAALLNEPQHESGILMGVTTEVLGQDGLSYAPMSPQNYTMYRTYLSGLCGLPPAELDMSTIAAYRSHYHRRCAVNTVALVPHCAVRLGAVGFHDVPLTGEALDHARRIVDEGMEQGAAGFATGLGFFPAAYATTEELIEIARVVARRGGVFVLQHRFFHTERAAGGGGAREVIEIGLKSGVKVHLAHWRTSPEQAGRVDELMAEIDLAKRQGLDITLDAYPYPAGATMPVCRLPGWFVEGGPEATLERLRDPDATRRVVKDLDDRYGDSLGDCVFTYVGSQRNRHLEGMSWRDVARESGEVVAEMICRVMREEDLNCGLLVTPPTSAAIWRQMEADVMNLIQRPDYTVGSDAIPVGGSPHPRAYGAFPRILGRLRRRHGASLELLIQRMTGKPASRFQLKGRGEVRKGCFADLVVFDPLRINDLATYEDPRVAPAGIPFVVVNGKVAVDAGRPTGVLAGEAIP